MRTIERENELTIYLEEDEELELTCVRFPIHVINKTLADLMQ